MRAIYLKDSQAIHEGSKTAIVLPRKIADLQGRYALAMKDDDGVDWVIGVVDIAGPTPLHTEQFEATHNEHGISTKERLQWWQDTQKFWKYDVRSYTPVEPEIIEIPSGTKLRLEIQQETLWSQPVILKQVGNTYIIGQKEL